MVIGGAQHLDLAAGRERIADTCLHDVLADASRSFEHQCQRAVHRIGIAGLHRCAGHRCREDIGSGQAVNRRRFERIGSGRRGAE